MWNPTFSADHESVRRRAREFFAREATCEVLATMERDQQEHSREFTQKVGSAGLLGLAWPESAGGRGAGQVAQAIVNEEGSYHRAPIVGSILSQIVGSTLNSLEQTDRSREVIGGLRDGSTSICLGYTEPRRGSDLAHLETTAVSDGDSFVVNGHKAFQSAGHLADYMFLAARSNPETDSHNGLTMFLVPANTPGIEVKPSYTLGGLHVNEVIYTDVRVHAETMVGELDGGWEVLRVALTFGRTVPWRVGQARRLRDQILAAMKLSGSKERERMRDAVARACMRVDVASLLVYRVLWMVDNGAIPMREAAISKLYISQLIPELAELATRVLGSNAVRGANHPDADLRGEIDWAYRHFVERRWAEGATEVQRDIIARGALAMPRR